MLSPFVPGIQWNIVNFNVLAAQRPSHTILPLQLRNQICSPQSTIPIKVNSYTALNLKLSELETKNINKPYLNEMNLSVTCFLNRYFLSLNTVTFRFLFFHKLFNARGCYLPEKLRKEELLHIHNFQ